jgi:hypothetical protein
MVEAVQIRSCFSLVLGYTGVHRTGSIPAMSTRKQIEKSSFIGHYLGLPARGRRGFDSPVVHQKFRDTQIGKAGVHCGRRI